MGQVRFGLYVNDEPKNKGKIQADATVADQYITYPTDNGTTTGTPESKNKADLLSEKEGHNINLPFSLTFEIGAGIGYGLIKQYGFLNNLVKAFQRDVINGVEMYPPYFLPSL